MPDHPTLLLLRHPRELELSGRRPRSWLGGAPRLEGQDWPRGPDGKPLHFAAMIDLAEVAAASGPTALPSRGALAVFIGGKCAVLHVADPARAVAVMPPEDTPDLTVTGGRDAWRLDPDGRPLFPRWPLAFHRLELPDGAEPDNERDRGAYHQVQREAVSRIIGLRRYNFSAEEAFAGPPVPMWWHIGLEFAAHLAASVERIPKVVVGEHNMLAYATSKRDAATTKAELAEAEKLIALYEGRLRKIEEMEPRLRAYAAEVAAWTSGHDRWTLMDPDDQKQLAGVLARNATFGDHIGYLGSTPVDFFVDQVLRALPASGTPSYAALPANVRALIDAKRAPRPLWWFIAQDFARHLGHVRATGVPAAATAEEKALATDRTKLAGLKPSGALARFWRILEDGKAKEAAKLEARIAEREAKLAGFGSLEVALQRFCEDTSAWAGAHDPWSRMAPGDVADLRARFELAVGEFGAFTRYHMPQRLEDLETPMLIAMAAADAGWAALPAHVRELIDGPYRIAGESWHQMFGVGLDIQGQASDMHDAGYVMLLQLTYDDLMHWSFGDVGCCQLWIKPRDLAARNWSAVRTTWASH